MGERLAALRERLSKPGWKLLGLAVVGGVLWVGTPKAARRLDFFRVRQVELRGVRFLSPEVVLDSLRLARRASIFDDLAPYEARMARLPGASAARVSRKLPGTLRVEIDETAPVALAPTKRRGVAMIDAHGRVLPFDPARSAPDLPLASAPDSLVARLLGTVRAVEPGTYARVTSARRMDGDVVLEVGGRRLLFRPGASAEEIRAVMAVAQDLGRQNRTFRELDGRFAGQVVVRGMGAGPTPSTAREGA